MNKLFSALLLTIISFSTATAQDYDYTPVKSRNVSKMKLGVFIAPNISWMKPTSNKSADRLYLVSNNGSKAGFTWGLMADFMFAENYGIATGFQLNSTGGNILATQNPTNLQTGANVVKSADFSYRLQYMEIPLGLKLKSDPIAGGIRIFGLIGGSLGINISKKATYEVTYTATNSAGVIVDSLGYGEREKITGVLSIAPAILQLNVGAGTEIPITEKMALQLGLYFNNGFIPDVTNPNKYDLEYKGKFSDGDIRLNNFALRIGLFF